MSCELAVQASTVPGACGSVSSSRGLSRAHFNTAGRPRAIVPSPTNASYHATNALLCRAPQRLCFDGEFIPAPQRANDCAPRAGPRAPLIWPFDRHCSAACVAPPGLTVTQALAGHPHRLTSPSACHGCRTPPRSLNSHHDGRQRRLLPLHHGRRPVCRARIERRSSAHRSIVQRALCE